MIYDRELLFGTCGGEAMRYVGPVLLVTLVLYGLARLASKRVTTANLRILPPLTLGVGALIVATISVSMLSGITATIAAANGRLSVTSCRGLSAQQEHFQLDEIATRFVLQTKAKGPPTPLFEFVHEGRQVASVWPEQSTFKLETLETIAPEAARAYRRWKASL